MEVKLLREFFNDSTVALLKQERFRGGGELTSYESSRPFPSRQSGDSCDERMAIVKWGNALAG